MKTLLRNFCLFTIPFFPIAASAQSGADFFKDQNGFFFFMGINHNMVHLVWDEIKDGSMQGYALERSEDGVTYSAIASCMAAHSLSDIMGLSASKQDEINNNPFERLLYTTETGSGRFIYNQSVTDAMLSSNQQWYYRIKFIRTDGNVTYSGIRSFDFYRQYRKGVDNTYINNATNKEQHAHDLKTAGSGLETIYGNQKNTPTPLPTPQACPTVQTLPSGACTTGVVQSNIPCTDSITGNPGNYTMEEYLLPGNNCIGTCCCNIDCSPSSYDDCCVHTCAEYNSCSCVPWICCNSNTQWIVTQGPLLPTVTVTSNAGCASNSAATANTSGGTGPFTYLWSPGGSTTQIISNIIPGNYTVTVIDANGYSSTAIATVVPAYPFPVAAFISNNVCIGQLSVFTDNSTLSSGTITGWSWNFGDGDISALQNPVHIYTNTGTFVTTLVVTSSPNGCTDTSAVTVIVDPCSGVSAIYDEQSLIIPL